MKFITPPAYHLVVEINFPQEIDNYRQLKQTKIILDELENFLREELGKINCLKKGNKKSLRVDYFLAKENSHNGAKKEIKATLKKLYRALKQMEKKYHIKLRAYIFNELSDFFNN